MRRTKFHDRDGKLSSAKVITNDSDSTMRMGTRMSCGDPPGTFTERNEINL